MLTELDQNAINNNSCQFLSNKKSIKKEPCYINSKALRIIYDN